MDGFELIEGTNQYRGDTFVCTRIFYYSINYLFQMWMSAINQMTASKCATTPVDLISAVVVKVSLWRWTVEAVKVSLLIC